MFCKMTDLMTVNDVSNVIVFFFFSFGDDVSFNEFDEANSLLSIYSNWFVDWIKSKGLAC